MNAQRFLVLFVAATMVASLMFFVSWSRDQKRITHGNITERTLGDDAPNSGSPLYNDSTDLKYVSISEPAQYKNMVVYLIKGNAEANDEEYVVLHDALKRKLVSVKETGEVNELKLDNNSDEYVYINSGDIVRGGKQDRTIQYDVVIPPRKKNVDLASFCVERGRWTNRGNEQVGTFSGSEKALSSKELKVAAKYAKNQTAVWDKVDKYQRKANASLNKANNGNRPVEVKSAVSATSLELTLDNETIVKTKQEYRQHLLEQLKDRDNALGFAYLINGKLYAVDVYNNHKLFEDLFEKLLDAAISEAISEDSIANGEKATVTTVRKTLDAAAKVYNEIDVNEITRFKTSECPEKKDIVIFTTVDQHVKNWLHRNWLDKTES